MANNYINNVLTELDGDKEKTEDEQNTERYDFGCFKNGERITPLSALEQFGCFV